MDPHASSRKRGTKFFRPGAAEHLTGSAFPAARAHLSSSYPRFGPAAILYHAPGHFCGCRPSRNAAAKGFSIAPGRTHRSSSDVLSSPSAPASGSSSYHAAQTLGAFHVQKLCLLQITRWHSDKVPAQRAESVRTMVCACPSVGLAVWKPGAFRQTAPRHVPLHTLLNGRLLALYEIANDHAWPATWP